MNTAPSPDDLQAAGIPARGRLVPRLGVLSVSSPLEVGADRAPRAAASMARWLEEWGCEVVEIGPVDDPEKSAAAGKKLAEAHVQAAVVVAASWFEDYLVLDLLEECAAPLLVWALPGMETGALCGTQQLAAYLAQLGLPHRSIFGTMEDPRCRDAARAFLSAAALKHRLRRARIGLAGHRVAGMTEVSANEFALKKALGPRVVPLDLPRLLSRAAEIADDRARGLWQALVARAGRSSVGEEDGLDSMKVYLAVKELVGGHRLDALTVGCYPHLMGRVCLAASLLADEGVPMGCEGDVNGAIGQLILTLLTGSATHNTDWLDPLEDGSIVLTHCGSGSFDLAERREDITLGHVRLMNRGVCALFPAKPGPVTLLNLIPRGDGYQAALLEGEAISTDMVFPGNPLRVRFAEPIAGIQEWIYEKGIGHHWMASYGHVGAELREWARLCGLTLQNRGQPPVSS